MRARKGQAGDCMRDNPEIDVRRVPNTPTSPAATVRYIARNAFQSAKKATRLTHTGITGPEKEIFPGNAIPIKGRLKKGKSPLKRRSHFLHVEKNVLKYPEFN